MTQYIFSQTRNTKHMMNSTFYEFLKLNSSMRLVRICFEVCLGFTPFALTHIPLCGIKGTYQSIL
jgi:hypothetical protein